MQVGVLGPLIPAGITRPAQRRLLSILALERRGISRDRLIDRMWGEAPPKSARNALHVHVNGLRQLLPEDAIETTGSGYRLGPDIQTDSHEFEIRLNQVLEREEGRSRLEDIEAIIDLWCGDPYPDLASDGFARAEISRLTELRMLAHERRIEMLLDLGREDEAIADLRQLVEEDPLRESLRAHLMLALYRTARQADALREYQTVRRVLGEELGIEPSPTLRDLEERILLHDPELGRANGHRAPTNLEAQTTSFVGREEETDSVIAALGPGELVTIVGGPGLGKTRLAAEVGTAVLPHHPDGVWFVSLAAASSGLEVAAEIATATGVQSSIQSVTGLASALAGHRSLIILDDCDHVVDPCRIFAADIVAAGGCTSLLVTSRRPLGMDDESVIRLRPLGTGLQQPVASPLADAGVQLFLDRVTSIDPTFSVDDESAEAIASLVTRLDGIPLAIELAARWASAIDVSDISDMLDASAPEKESDRSLQSAIDWSLDLLASDDRDLLLATAVFASSFSLEAAHSVCRPDRQRAQFSAAMARLVDSSLVAVERGHAGLRYRSLAPIRERLLDLGHPDQRAIADRHAQFFLSLAASGLDDLYGTSVDQAELEASISDVRSALSHGLATNMDDDVARALARLGQYFHPRYLHWESQTWLDQALARDLDPVVRAQALGAKGSGAQILGWQDAAAVAFEEAMEIFEAHGMKDHAMRILLSLSGMYSDRGDWEAGFEAAKRNHDHVRRSGNESAIAMARYYMGENAFGGGDLELGLSEMAASADAFDAIGEYGRVAYTGSQACRAAILAGETTEAARLADLATNASQLSESGYSLGKASMAASLVAVELGDLGRAAALLLAVDGHVSDGHPDEITDILLPAGMMHMSRGELDRAATIAASTRAKLASSDNALPIPWQEVLDKWLDAPPTEPEPASIADLRVQVAASLRQIASDSPVNA